MNFDDIAPIKTYYQQEEYISRMTMTVGFIAKKMAIVIAADGREIDKRGKVLDDKTDKIYELSSNCIIMYTGNVPASIGDRMAQFYGAVVALEEKLTTLTCTAKADIILASL